MNEEQKQDPFAGWEKLYGRPLSEAERLEIGTNLKGFFGLLHKWAQEEAQEAQKKGESNDAKEKDSIE